MSMHVFQCFNLAAMTFNLANPVVSLRVSFLQLRLAFLCIIAANYESRYNIIFGYRSTHLLNLL